MAKSLHFSRIELLLERMGDRYAPLSFGLCPTYETAPGVFVHDVTDSVPILGVKLELIPENEGTGDNEADATRSDGSQGARAS